MEMRRKDLAVTEKEQIDAIIQSCDCVRLAFADGTHPYIVPLSFGYHREDGVSKFYFHSAAAGRKVELCRKLGYAGFELIECWRKSPPSPGLRWDGSPAPRAPSAAGPGPCL